MMRTELSLSLEQVYQNPEGTLSKVFRADGEPVGVLVEMPQPSGGIIATRTSDHALRHFVAWEQIWEEVEGFFAPAAAAQREARAQWDIDLAAFEAIHIVYDLTGRDGIDAGWVRQATVARAEIERYGGIGSYFLTEMEAPAFNIMRVEGVKV